MTGVLLVFILGLLLGAWVMYAGLRWSRGSFTALCVGLAIGTLAIGVLFGLGR